MKNWTEEEILQLKTLAEQWAAISANEPLYVERLGPGKARALFMLGAQSAMHIIAIGGDPNDLDKVMRSLADLHLEIGRWLGIVPPGGTKGVEH